MVYLRKVNLNHPGDHNPHGEDSLAFKVAVVGAGHVGATFAYSLLLSGLTGEIVLIDANKKRAEGEVMDLNHAVPLTFPPASGRVISRDCAGLI